MSDLNDLIHTNATRAYMTGQTRGRIEERERILQIIAWLFPSRPNDPIEELIKLIKGEQENLKTDLQENPEGEQK